MKENCDGKKEEERDKGQGKKERKKKEREKGEGKEIKEIRETK